MLYTVSLDPKTLLAAYGQGLFPMADGRGDVRWYTADPRGIIPLEPFHIPRTLRTLLRKSPGEGGFEIRINHDFESTMRACREDRQEGSWISKDLITAYVRLHEMGFAHSVEAWKNGRLAGGLYGVSIGGAFLRREHVPPRARCQQGGPGPSRRAAAPRGYELLDTQAVTPHLEKFGCIEIPAEDYLARLRRAASEAVRFHRQG